MNGINLLILIIPRETEDEYIRFLRDMDLSALFGFPCNGTAGRRLLSLLGLEETEKSLLMTVAERKKALKVMRRAVSDMGLNLPGNGIALTIPVDSVGGASSLKALMENQNYIVGEVSDMEQQEFPCALIVAVAERGGSDLVMEAARSAGAGGGTIVHAKGTAGELAQRFLGVSIAAEKEMVLIVVRRADKAAVMRAIMEHAGIHTSAHTVLFALPVESVAGLKSVMDEE